MRTGRLMSIAQSWTGILAAVAFAVSAVLLLSFHIQGRIVGPGDKARIESLKEEAKSDIEVQKILQPEMDRQHRDQVRRRAVYGWGGWVLLISAGALLAWLKWFRPGPGEWAGVPAKARAFLEGAFSFRDTAAPGRVPVETAAGKGFQFPGLPLASSVPPPAEALDLGPVQEILEATGRNPASVIPILQAIQARYRYLPGEVLKHVCEATEIRPAQIAGVSTFYGQFRHSPVGEHIIRVCEGTACHVSGAVEVDLELRRCLGITNGSDTDPSGRFTIERVACIGSCSLAPVITIDEDIRGRLSALTAGKALWDAIQSGRKDKKNGNGGHGPGEIAPARAKPARKPGRPVEIRIGLGSCGVASGARQVRQAIEEVVEALGGGAEIKPVGCIGYCHCEPLVEVVDNGRRTLYGSLAPGDVRRIVRRHVKPRGLVRKIREDIRDARARLTEDSAWLPAAQWEVDAGPYAKKQVRVVLENCGRIDPLSIDDYIAREGFRALDQVLDRLSPEEAIDRVRASGLRGRGGAGFPTAVKWEIARQAPGPVKYVICNGDEGDPGAFMDRAVL
ncbi:MAG: hypothetical protein FJW35_18310, partial [Acidobacteria bacterium]|nr:hypothetical protein [Acidobacteriota bacterium]